MKHLVPQSSVATALVAISLIAVSVTMSYPKLQELAPEKPALYLIGDSTVRNGRGDGSNGQWGWGEPLVAYFDPARITVVNRALGGRSSRTFLTGGQWQTVLKKLRPGDFVIMQFGHNDGGAINDDSRARGTLKGIGEETEEIDNLLTEQREVVHSYGWYLRRYISDTKARGATPIVCSPIPRKMWKEGRIVRSSEDYGKWAKQVAVAEKVLFLDLNEVIAKEYEELGEEKVETFFADERTHTSLAGAEFNARCVIASLKMIKPNPLAPYFSEKGKILNVTTS